MLKDQQDRQSAAQKQARRVFRGFDYLPVEDKEEKGKGTTGDTLERRKKQGSFFCTVVNIRFNIHINIG